MNEALDQKSIKILIAEGVPSLNKGEMAILIGMLKTFDELGKVEVSIFSYYPSIDKERYPKKLRIINIGNDLYLKNSLTENTGPVRFLAVLSSALQHSFFAVLYKLIGKTAVRIMNKPIWTAYWDSDVIIVCHDGVDFIGGWILNFSPVYITLLASFLHKPVVIYANGGTRIKREIWEKLAKRVLNFVSLITLRDEDSFFYFRSLTANPNMHLTGDPAILTPPADYERVDEIIEREKIPLNSNMLIGAIISNGVLLLGSRGNLEKYSQIIINVANVLDRLVETYEATLVFVPHCIDPYLNNDDRTIAKKIYDKMKNKENVRLIVNEYSSEELKGLMGKLDIMLTSRVHAGIGALSMYIPTCTITGSSDRRAFGLIGKLLKQEKWVFNIEDLEPDAFFKKITELISESEKIQKELPFIVDSARKKALQNGKLLKTMLESQSFSED